MSASYSRDKIKTLKRLLSLREAWRWEGKSVIFTNGVFDLLHAGHVQSLEKAKSLGDILIVGLNSDASARRLGKGPGRPINGWKDRAAVLAALACVDAVAKFDEDTPTELLRHLRPDVLAKGADYRKSQVAGREYAGKVALIPLAAGRSTTALIGKISRLARLKPTARRS